jgi:hypothetical protein
MMPFRGGQEHSRSGFGQGTRTCNLACRFWRLGIGIRHVQLLEVAVGCRDPTVAMETRLSATAELRDPAQKDHEFGAVRSPVCNL